MKQLVFAFAGMALIASCSQKTTSTASKPAEKALSAEAAQGQALFTANCGKCHKLPEIKAYSQEKWQKIVPPMAKKSKLDASQEALIMTYVNESLK